MAEHGLPTGYTDAVSLTPDELEAVVGREQQVYRGAATIFTISERLRRSFLEDFGIPAERVRAVHAGPNFDIARIPYPRPGRDVSRAPTIVFVGRQFERKGGDLLLKAFQRVRQRIPGAQLIIVGPDQPALQLPGVAYLGSLDKSRPEGWAALARAYASADVFCLPTRFEPFGIAFLEAMFFGLPCIGTDAWAVPEMIRDGETGFTIPIDDLDAIGDRLLRLLSDPGLARRMGQAGRERAEKYFTWPAVVRRMLGTLTTVVERAQKIA
jgi:glycosyltransferase involved in cell wall biosynthesis